MLLTCTDAMNMQPAIEEITREATLVLVIIIILELGSSVVSIANVSFT